MNQGESGWNQGEFTLKSWKSPEIWMKKPWKKGEKLTFNNRSLFFRKSGFFSIHCRVWVLPDSGRIRAKSPWFRESIAHESPWNQGDSGRIRANFALFHWAEQRSICKNSTRKMTYICVFFLILSLKLKKFFLDFFKFFWLQTLNLPFWFIISIKKFFFDICKIDLFKML